MNFTLTDFFKVKIHLSVKEFQIWIEPSLDPLASLSLSSHQHKAINSCPFVCLIFEMSPVLIFVMKFILNYKYGLFVDYLRTS